MAMTTGTLACTTCGHQVAPDARRCPSCNAKRPAPTVANLVKTLIALAVVVVLLVALIVGRHGSGGKSQVERVRSQYGTCLASAGVSLDGADVTSSAVEGWHAVFLSDGAEFGVEDSTGKVEAGNDRANTDLAAGGC